MPALKESGSAAVRSRRFFRNASLSHILVAGQIAISMLMLVAASLFVRTLQNLEAIDVGFNRQNMLLFQLDARQAGHKDPEIVLFYAGLRNQFRAIPGIREASLSEDSLITAGTGFPLSVLGEAPNPKNLILRVGPAFFRTMQIPILAGRDIEPSDRAGSPAVALVNQAFVKANLAGRNPIGQHLILSKSGTAADVSRDMAIIGVCRNSTYGDLTGEARPVAYIPYDQGFPEPDQMVYALRTSGDPLRYVNAVREVVRQADPRVPVADVRTQVAEIEQTVSQEITFAKLCSGFAMLALAIACVGLYGTVSYSVVRRTSEIGIRMALGAQRGTVVRMILREVLALAAAGLTIGAGAALATSKFVASFLYGIQHNDAGAYLSAIAILLGAALLAGYIPGRKASRIDPIRAVRHK